MKWQPIETAPPTDGTRILLCGRDGKIADGHYGQPDRRSIIRCRRPAEPASTRGCMPAACCPTQTARRPPGGPLLSNTISDA